MPKEFDPKLFVATWNNVTDYPALSDVAAALGISIKTARNKAGFFRAVNKDDPATPQLVTRASMNEVPLSEDTSKFMDKWTADDCIAELQRIAKLDTEMVISRNYFRNHSAISEATWNRYFGTFTEFKRQAGLMLTRQQHQLERQIAKHASVDHYRTLAVDRANYANKYEKSTDSRIKTIIICSDLHDIEIDPFYLRVLIDTIARVQPDVVCFNGDIFDLPEFGRYGVDPREWNVVGRIQFVHENIFAPIRAAAPNAQLDFIEGNHEARMLRHLADESPAMRAVLADLHGWTISKLLGLDKYQINYVAKADLAAFTKKELEKELHQNFKIYYNTFVCHHFPNAREWKMPGVNGHHHKHIVWSDFNPMYGAFEWHQLGCGHRRTASYCAGEKWHMGFDIAHIDTQTRDVVHDYVTVSDFAVAGGVFYARAPSEVDDRVLKPLDFTPA